MKKRIFRDIIQHLLTCKQRNDLLITVRKLRRFLERDRDYLEFTTNFLSIRVAMSLEWLRNANYIRLERSVPQKKYLIPDDFPEKGRNLLAIKEIFT